jgi:hypothetical protein
MDLESIFPAPDRRSLAMTLNNVLAAPGFAGWSEGEPLDVQRMLYTAEGRPRLAVVSIAHLTDAQRMFFVTMLLNELLVWMRCQPGTASLRALLYMDEVFGYLPPTANPPSKLPLLTLLKQARAFGLGVVLATQNPVDLDYKALSNAGTWFLGRLQTERDKARVVDGLEGASSSAGVRFDRQRTEQILSGLKSRVFLMNNVHEDEPTVYQTRWTLSYLRGPLTRQQIQRLMQSRRSAPADVADSGATAVSSPRLAEAAAAAVAAPAVAPPSDAPAPMIPPEITQRYARAVATIPRSARLVYRPALLAVAQVHYVDRKSQTDHWQKVMRIHVLTNGAAGDPWEQSEPVASEQVTLEEEPLADARFAPLPSAATQVRQFDNWTKALRSFLYRTERLSLLYCAALKQYSQPNQRQGDFRVWIKDQARQQRDLAVEKLRQKYASRMESLEERLRKAQQRVEVEQGQSQEATISAAISLGTSMLGALFGRKLRSSSNVTRAGTSMRAARRAASQRGDISRAKENVEALEEDIRTLNQELEQEISELSTAWSVDQLEVETLEIKPRKTDITVEPVSLLWLPCAVDESGLTDPVWR